MYNFINIEFPNSQIGTVLSYRTSLTLNRYAHEMLSMYIQNWGLDYKQIEVGSPIKTTIRSQYGHKEFVGYVHSVTPDISANKNFVEVIALGASMSMKQASQKVWTKVSADQVITEIAKKHNFSYHCEPHPRVYDHLAQTGETDWEFISKLAFRSGYTLRAEGTSIYFEPYMKNFDSYKESAPYFVIRESNHPNGSNLFKFSPEINESANHEGAMKAATSVGGIDLNQGNSIVITNPNRPAPTRKTSRTESFDRFNTGAVIPNMSVANYEAVAADERARFPYRGTAVVLGDARLRPDLPVYLDGVGTEYSGFWTILECTHIVEEMKYTTELVIGTDSLGGVSGGKTSIPHSIPVRIVSPNTPGKSKVPKAVLTRNTVPYNKANNKNNTGFGNMVKNRAQPSVTRSTHSSSSKWIGTSGNLRVAPQKSNASAAAVARLRSQGVR